MPVECVIGVADGVARLERLRARRLAEDERLVCMERARILHASREQHAHLPRGMSQAAILRDLCLHIPPILEPEDILVGRMPEVLPTGEEERWIAEHPELFTKPGVPGWLDGMSLYIPDWHWLLSLGIGGIASRIERQQEALTPGDTDSEARREFLAALLEAVRAVSALVSRYADAARHSAVREQSETRRQELLNIAARCDRLSWQPPASFLEALQLLQIVHMVLSCLVGGRDVTPGRLDQYLLRFYQDDLSRGRLTRDQAGVLLAMFFLRLSQMAGNGTDFDDNARRSPCQYTHLYVTVGGVDTGGHSAVNALSFVVLEAIRLLDYKEPTVVVRCHENMDRAFQRKMAELVRLRRPVTIYHDEVVIRALVNQGIGLVHARGYAHCACHNVVVVGQEAGTGVGGFHNMPRLILRAMNADAPPGSEGAERLRIETFAQFWAVLQEEVQRHLEAARRDGESAWREDYEKACPLLPSALNPECVRRQQSWWQCAPVSHFNHYLLGLGTAVDSLVAIRRLVFAEKRFSLPDLVHILASDWAGDESLRQQIRTRFPRYGQDDPEADTMAAALGRLWVEEVERVSQGMIRFQMWPGFYSHMMHVTEGDSTPATPDGRKAGDPLSENMAPSFGTSRCSPLSILKAMSVLPFDHTPSGAATLTLAESDLQGEEGADRLLALIETYFRMGGLHLQINMLDGNLLEAALRTPERYPDLMVRVTGFSAYFARLSRNVQEDIVQRRRRDGGLS